MENQHEKIKGYRDLTQSEIDLMNRVKDAAETVGNLCDALQSTLGLDQRWISAGKTDLQKGFMSITRGIAKPTSF